LLNQKLPRLIPINILIQAFIKQIFGQDFSHTSKISPIDFLLFIILYKKKKYIMEFKGGFVQVIFFFHRVISIEQNLHE